MNRNPLPSHSQLDELAWASPTRILHAIHGIGALLPQDDPGAPVAAGVLSAARDVGYALYLLAHEIEGVREPSAANRELVAGIRQLITEWLVMDRGRNESEHAALVLDDTIDILHRVFDS